MKKITSIFIICISFVACKKDNNNNAQIQAASNGILTLSVKNMVGVDPLVMSDMRYISEAGNPYSVNLLKYYISNIVLYKKAGGSKSFPIYKLIDASDLSTCSFQVGQLDAGDYDSIAFSIGVDPTRNHTGVQDGDLDVSKGMFWTWNTGYIFFKHEGQFKTSANQTKALIFHLGTDAAYTSIKMPIALTINGDKTMEIKYDVNSAYYSPVIIDFNTDFNHQSSSSSDAPWIANMKSNLADAFSFIKVQ